MILVAQVPVDLDRFDKNGEASVSIDGNFRIVTWPSGEVEMGKIYFNLKQARSTNLDPIFDFSKNWNKTDYGLF